MPPSNTAPSFASEGSPNPTAERVRKLTLRQALASARETKALHAGPNLLHRLPEVFRENFPGAQAVVVGDAASMLAAGRRVADILAQADLAPFAPFVFETPHLYAEHAFVETLEASFRGHNAIPVAVGSGTINDLVKLAAHRVGRPYLCVATAASMDGYTAFGASITFQGAKQTFNCPAPRVVVADLTIVCAAPPPMTASGYADLQAKITAGADWILADGLKVDPIDPRAWEIVQGGLRDALADPAGARHGQPDAIRPLIEGLMLGGFAMQWMKSSRPASGAEHQFSHLWDMEHHVHHGEAPSHGFKVGVATLAVAALYEKLLELPLEQLDVARCCASWPAPAELESLVRERFAGDDLLPTALAETRAKHSSPAVLQGQLELLKRIWPALRDRLRAQLLPQAELKRRLQLVGAPTEPEEIGITRRRLRASFLRAYHIRRRFTVLDLVVRAGVLDELLDTLFGPAGRWEIAPQPPVQIN